MKARIFLALGLTPFLLLLAPCRPGSNIFPGAHVESVSARSPRLSKPALTEYASRVDRSGKSQFAGEINSRPWNELDRAGESVSDRDLPAVLEGLARTRGTDATELSLPLIRRWAEIDPAGAAAWLSRFAETPLARLGFEQVAIAWANSDLAAATAFVEVMPEGGTKQSASIALAYEAARTQPLVALGLARDLQPSRERDDLLVHAVSQWAGADAVTAAEWARNVTDRLLRQHLVSAVAIASAESDPAAAATLAASAMEAGDELDRTAVSIIQRWAQHSPESAAAWVSQFPDSPSLAPAIESLLAAWVPQDPAAARNWLHELPKGLLHDFGTNAYFRALADP
jgi:hypothetical protein